MSKYTAKGSEELDARIDDDLARITDHAWPHCVAGVLLGGYGRGEGTPFINPDGTQSPFNDYDLIVVVDELNEKVRHTFHALEIQLSDALGLTIDLCPYLRSDLPHAEFSLLNYEMKYGHKVVWGDDHILDAMPEYPHGAIPLFEGSRLLLNRGKLLLDIKQRLTDPQPLDEEERIRFIKFIHKVLLAFGDAALLAADQYDISYAVKKDRIQHVGNCPERDYVIDGYLKAIALKEWGDYQALEHYDIETEYNRARNVFLTFLPWYRAQYTTRECKLMKAVALNLHFNGRPLPRHPRLYLYDAIILLLSEKPNIHHLKEMLFCNDRFVERFYALQKRFS
jgi:hypothetical protein